MMSASIEQCCHKFSPQPGGASKTCAARPQIYSTASQTNGIAHPHGARALHPVFIAAGTWLDRVRKLSDYVMSEGLVAMECGNLARGSRLKVTKFHVFHETKLQ
jgi:hypothetical protein